MIEPKLKVEQLKKMQKSELINLCMAQEELIYVQEKRVNGTIDYLAAIRKIKRKSQLFQWKSYRFQMKADMIIMVLWAIVTIMHIIRPTIMTAPLLYFGLWIILIGRMMVRPWSI